MNTKLEEITIENIRKHFKNINEVNDYGGLVHAAVHNRYFRASVLKFIEVLFENGVDVNLKGKDTGYSFIHLALYGYTDEKNVDYSYTTEFIVELINLGKKYGLDVGIVDGDSDSLIHTALASEVYVGSVVALIDALGEQFDISCLDGDGNNIYQALFKYKQEAKKNDDNVWLKKLTKEESEIKKRVELAKLNLDDINKELVELRNKIKEYSTRTDIKFITENYNDIIELHKRVDYYINLRNMLTNNDCSNRIDIWSTYNELLRKTISNCVEEITRKPDFSKIEGLVKVTNALGFSDINVTLEEIKKSYQERIDLFKEKISKIEFIEEIKKLEKELADFNEERIKNELKVLLENREKEFFEVIGKIQTQFDILKFVNSWLEENNSNLEENADLLGDYSYMSLEELKKLNSRVEKTLKEHKDLVKQVLVDKMEDLLLAVRKLTTDNIFQQSELFEILENSIKTEKDKVMVKNGRV